MSFFPLRLALVLRAGSPRLGEFADLGGNAREIVLSQGLSIFSTPDAILPYTPRHISPFAPAFSLTGDIADTVALRQWVEQTVVPAAK